MKIGLSFVTLASSLLLVLSVNPAQARSDNGQYFTRHVAKNSQTGHFTNHLALPSDMRGQDQLSTPGWSHELPY
jgi:hypothetical protein